ncbi:MAG TPA: hypothetical protein VGC72_14990 [Candidatus Elarobacter sp.]
MLETPTRPVTRWSTPPNDKHRIRRARVENPPRRGGRTPQTYCDGIAFRLVRVIWLTAIFARRESVTIADYRRRFGVSLRSFRRDVALLRDAGFYLETIAANQYRMLSFDRDSDAP